MQYNMLHKSELKIKPVKLNGVNLHRIADCVADIYKVDRDKVLVIDVRNDEVALDILDDSINPHYFMAKEKELLDMIGAIPGVVLDKKARVTSDGMLGWIAFGADPDTVEKSLNRADDITRSVQENIAKRVKVFPSGAEVEAGEIEDTNTPMLIKAFVQAGYKATAGAILKDSLAHIVQNLKDSVYSGYGVVITTGGVGAEDKDHSVEAILKLDPHAATPYIAKFEKGHGRHVKDGIRIGVGSVDLTRLIALPGPNDEVALCIPILLEGIQNKSSNEKLAEALANVLRKRLQDKCSHMH